ncbi:MAG: asparagine--tRNA ligase [Deltaproteobacteria bacterium]
MKHTDINRLFENPSDFLNKETIICGWVKTARDSKNMCFIEINDGTTLKNIQLVIDKNVLSIDKYKNAMNVGCAVKVDGIYVQSEVSSDSFEINVTNIDMLGAAPTDYPLQKKRHTLEYLRTIPHLRVRTNTFIAMHHVRSELSMSIHDFFQKNGYLYIHTPIISGSDCEGAGEVFRITTQSWNCGCKTEEEYFENDFFGRPAGLTVSGQMEGEVAAMALGKIYTFGPTFRAENSNTTRHVSEFWMIEPEAAFAELEDIMELAEEFIKHTINHVLFKCRTELEFFDKFFEKGLIEKLNSVVNSDFAVVQYTEAVELLKKSGKEFKYPVEWESDLQTEHERYLTEEVYNKPLFIVNYPKKLKAFYMKQNSDGKTVAAADLLVPGIGEIIGGSEREADYDLLVDAMKSRGMNIESYTEYLDLRKFGTAPHGGFGLGLERLLMYVTGIANIRDTLLYPRAPKEL